MALPPLATAADLEFFGYAGTPEEILDRASARVRRHTRQQITPGTSTLTLETCSVRLPQRPVTSVVSVKEADDEDVTYKLKHGGILIVQTLRSGPVTVEWEHGLDPLPEELVELVCSIANRLATTPVAVAAGVTSEQAGGESLAWGSDAWRGTTGLTEAEKAALDKLFPRLPSTITLRP